jgi:2-polyprenyl-3-methyl-5-hydroxy-6-metoxy-1,4-benzoquinol methylase
MRTAINAHLNYYLEHRINPVRYDTSNLQLHIDRRASLYRTLGVTPLAVRGARVLEVAPGTGQNSLYLARLAPHSLTLVEPNPIAIRDIATVYATPGLVPAPPLVIEARFEDYEPDEPFDVVVCENWLGSSEHERRLLAKLGRMVAECGLLLVTTVSPVGMLPNLLRRALAQKLISPDSPFAMSTAVLCRAFGPHLRTLTAMTRGVTDWVQDNMLNPAYFGIQLTVPMVLSDLGHDFEVLGSSPRFAADWRWFKGLCGPQRDFNRHALTEYRAELHNFFDHRTVLPMRDPNRNAEFEAGALGVCKALRLWEAGDSHEEVVESAVRRVIAGMADLPPNWPAALEEFLDAFADSRLTPEAVAGLPLFGPLFGRETVYLCFERPNRPLQTRGPTQSANR